MWLIRHIPFLLFIVELDGRLIREGNYSCRYQICIPDDYPEKHPRHYFKVWKDNFEKITDTVNVNLIMSYKNGKQDLQDALKKIDVKNMVVSLVPTVVMAWQDRYLKFQAIKWNNTEEGPEYVKLDPSILSWIIKPQSPKIDTGQKLQLTRPNYYKSGKFKAMEKILFFC